jgi:hypothetical protein
VASAAASTATNAASAAPAALAAPATRPGHPAPADSYDGTRDMSGGGMRLSSAFERTLDTWNDRDAVAGGCIQNEHWTDV